MAFDPTISTGNLLTMATIVVGAGVFIIRQSYALGQQRRDYENAMDRHRQDVNSLRGDLGEIKQTLKEQDRESRDRAKADALADGIISVLQQRVMTCENELGRCRENIHRIANAVQVEIAKARQQGD